MKLLSGHTVVPLEGAELKKQEEDFVGYKYGLVRLTPDRWLFPACYKLFADKLYNFKFRSSDVVVMTYPKCGTTWTQEIIWTMRNNPEFNHPKANTPVLTRSPFLDMDMLFPPSKPGTPPPENKMIETFLELCPSKNPDDGVTLQMAEFIPDPRTIKTHLPFSLLTPSLLDTTKVVYVARNPKDLIISYHHHSRLINMHEFRGSFEDFVQYFLDDDLMYSPYWLHVKEAWEKRNHPNLHFIFFEELKAKPMEELRKLNTFLNTNLTEKQLENICKYTSFSEMKRRDEVLSEQTAESDDAVLNTDVKEKEGGFFRKGVTGDWKGKLTPALEAKVNQWIEKNMTSFGIDFKYGK